MLATIEAPTAAVLEGYNSIGSGLFWDRFRVRLLDKFKVLGGRLRAVF